MPRLATVTAVALTIAGTALGAGRGNSIYFSGADPCPVPCGVAGSSSNWTVYHSTERLGYCPKSLALSLAVFNPLDDPTTGKTIQTCALGPASKGTTTTRRLVRHLYPRSGNATQHQQAPAQAAWRDPSSPSQPLDSVGVISQAQEMKSFLTSETATPGPSLLFLHRAESSTSIGLYAGSGVPTGPLVDALLEFVQSHGYSGDVLLQACSTGAISAAVGIVASTGPQSLVVAQRAVQDWANSTCVSSRYYENSLPLPTLLQTAVISSSPLANRRLGRRGVCRTVSVVSGNLCADLAQKCGISVTGLLKYNPQATFCTTLKVPQLVCCSAGDLPVPKPDANGNCATYKIQSGDSCWGITNSLSGLISTDNIEQYNKKTWGWGGCSNLQAGLLICLSPGTPPLPLPVSNALCGPIKPGTAAPPAGTNLSSLNACPLNACCNVWGQCGTTDEFCRPLPAGAAPGAPQPQGSPNCISNCGTSIVNNVCISVPRPLFLQDHLLGAAITRS